MFVDIFLDWLLLEKTQEKRKLWHFFEIFRTKSRRRIFVTRHLKVKKLFDEIFFPAENIWKIFDEIPFPQKQNFKKNLFLMSTLEFC